MKTYGIAFNSSLISLLTEKLFSVEWIVLTSSSPDIAATFFWSACKSFTNIYREKMVLFTENAFCVSFEEEGLLLQGKNPPWFPFGIPPAAGGAPKGPFFFFR